MKYTGGQYRGGWRSRRSVDRAVLRVLLCCACSGTAPSAYAETRAGDRVVNTASALYDLGAGQEVATSNTDVLLVAERLDVALSYRDTAPSLAIPFLVVNRGNGVESFKLSASVGGDMPIGRFAIDTDGDGAFDPAHDTLLQDATTPMLQPGATLSLLLIDAASTGPATIVAQATTGTGAPGTVFVGAGDGGGDAIVGPTGARAELVVPRTGQDLPPTLTKTQDVLAPDGSARAVRGAVISYTLVARFPSAATATRIDDPVPAGTTYVPGSLSLDGTALGDAGTSGTIGVALGDVPAASIRTLQFKVRIQ